MDYRREYKNERKIKEKFKEEENIYLEKLAKYSVIKYKNEIFDYAFDRFNNNTNMSLNKNNMNNIIDFYQEINLKSNMCEKHSNINSYITYSSFIIFILCLFVGFSVHKKK